MAYKQTILIRADLRLPKGKMAAQAAHAAVEAALRADAPTRGAWRREGMAKVVLRVDDEQALHTHIERAKQAGLATAVITDAGRTVVEPGTITCGAIGPAAQEKVDAITKALRLI